MKKRSSRKISYRKKSKSKKSYRKKRKSRKIKKDGVKSSNLLLPLLASTSLLPTESYLYPINNKERSIYGQLLDPKYTDSCNFLDTEYNAESYGETDLTFAIKNGNTFCTESFITPETINAKNQFNETPLTVAIYSENAEIVKTLIEKGADINMPGYRENVPLAQSGLNKETVKLLLNNDKIIINNDDKRLISYASYFFYTLDEEIIKLYIERGIDLTKTDRNGIPLYIYSMLANIIPKYNLNIINDLISFLIKVKPRNINILIGSFGLSTVLVLLYKIYLYLKKYIKIEKINIRLFKSLESIEKIVENMNLVNMLNDKLIYPEIIGLHLLHINTILYFSYKYKNSCIPTIPTIPTIPIGGKKLVKELKRFIKKVSKWEDTSLTFVEEEKKIEVPIDFWKNLKTCLMKPEVIFIIIPLLLFDKDYKTGHANFLIYNTKDKSLEHFEPHGYGPYSFDDNLILELFNKEMGKDFIKQYYKPLDFCPRYSVQILEILERPESFEEDYSQGFCSTWCYFYVDLRLSNPDVDRKDLVDIMIYQIIRNEKSFTEFIKEYSIILVQIYNKVSEQVEKGEKIEDIYTKIISDFLPT